MRTVVVAVLARCGICILLAGGLADCLQGQDADTAGATPSFDQAIAPLLARHCIECHGDAAPKGRLNLSTRSPALAGGKSGKAIVPGKPGESLAWKHVEADKMPKDRPPLTADEKQRLHAWIIAGAAWPQDAIVAVAARGKTTDGLRRLTVREYIATVRSAVGVDIEKDALRLLPADLRADGFSNTSYNLNVDLAHVEAYAKLAEITAGRMDAKAFAAGFSEQSGFDERALRNLIAGMGKRLLRGPLDDRELATYLAVAQAVQREGGDYEEAVRYLLEAMLQSPRFLYRLEVNDPHGQASQLSQHEVAARLSYILWGAPPDEDLMRAADAGELGERTHVAKQVERMLRDPRAIDQSANFLSEWMHLDRLASLRPGKERFPTWNDRLAADMREETLAYFRYVAWEQKRPLADLLNAQVTFATPRLARHYGLTSPGAAPTSIVEPSKPQRVGRGLTNLYTFRAGRGDVVQDAAEGGGRLPLKISDASAVRWKETGLIVSGTTLIASEQPASALARAVKASKGLTIEAWLTPANASQSGPARIVTLSSHTTARNFTLGQSGDRFEVRLRTTATSPNGEPSLSSAAGTAGNKPVHVVYTFAEQGDAVIYVNGEESGRQKIGGSFDNWDNNFRLALANEMTKDRAWSGVLHLVGIYDRSLTRDETRQNFQAGIVDLPLSLTAVESERSADGLQAAYAFDEGGGQVVRDVAGVGEPLHLKVDAGSDVEWNADGLKIKGPSLLTTESAPARLIAAIKQANAITIEAWVTPIDTTQQGPARIVTLSSGASQRNFTLGQEGDKYEARLRTTKTDVNGMPGLVSSGGSARAARTHLVFTRDAAGKAKLFVDGKEQAARDFAGDLSNWDGSFRLGVANESTRDRTWRGTLHRVAIYSRALTADEIRSSDGIDTLATLARYDLTGVPGRGGLLTHASVLTIGGDEASMVTRGLFVLRELLYSGVEDPPPCVDTTPVPTKPGISQRAVAMQRLANTACNACHARFEPLAFGLEKFDGVGAHHEVDEHGNKLHEDGEILFPDTDKPVSYKSSAELMDLLAKSQRVQRALTRKVTQFALGRPLVAADEPAVEAIHKQAIQGGGTYASLITAIVMSDLVLPHLTEKNP